MKLFRSILALLGIRVKVSVPGGSCPYCGARPPAHSEAWKKGQLVRLPRLSDPNYDPNDTQRPQGLPDPPPKPPEPPNIRVRGDREPFENKLEKVVPPELEEVGHGNHDLR